MLFPLKTALFLREIALFYTNFDYKFSNLWSKVEDHLIDIFLTWNLIVTSAIGKVMTVTKRTAVAIPAKMLPKLLAAWPPEALPLPPDAARLRLSSDTPLSELSLLSMLSMAVEKASSRWPSFLSPVFSENTKHFTKSYPAKRLGVQK